MKNKTDWLKQVTGVENNSSIAVAIFHKFPVKLLLKLIKNKHHLRNALIISSLGFDTTIMDFGLYLCNLTSVSMWVKLCLPFKAEEAVASRIWVLISLRSTSCVSGWVSTKKTKHKKTASLGINYYLTFIIAHSDSTEWNRPFHQSFTTHKGKL